MEKKKIFIFLSVFIVFLYFSSSCFLNNDDSENQHKKKRKKHSSHEINYNNEPIIDSRTPLNPYAQAKALGKGVNFGNLMDAYPQEGSWSNGITIEESHFNLAKNAGFDSVRVPIRFSNYASFNGPNYLINEDFLERIDKVITWGLSKGLRIVIDIHHYNNDAFVNNDPYHNDINKYPEENRNRFIEMWKQIASRYKDQPAELYYELLNEPGTNLTIPVWNDILSDCIHAIRQIDSYHTIIVGCTYWSNVYGLDDGLDSLIIPSDETNAIATFHYYTPIIFCNQGKDWMGPEYATTGIKWPAPPLSPVVIAPGVTNQWIIDQINLYNTSNDDTINPCGKTIIQEEILRAYNWGIANNRPLWMSEFTVHDEADMVSRVNWIKFVREELEKYNIPWSYWTLFTDDCYLYDLNNKKWIIELTEALGLNVSN